MVLALLHQGRLIPVPRPERALDFLGPTPGRRAVVGSPETVRAGLERVAAEYGAGEVTVVTITYDHDARRRSYALLAEAFELAPAAGAARADAA